MANAKNVEQQRSRGYPVRVSVGPADLLGLGPFSLMRRMSEEMERMLDRSESSAEEGRIAWVPVIEVAEQEGKYLVRAELPGVKPDDVKLEITNDAIVLQGERKFEQEKTAEGGIHLTERRYGRFYRSIPLPEGANAEQAKARFENGVLEITVPLEQKPQKRQIPIEASSESKQTPQGAQQAPEKAA